MCIRDRFVAVGQWNSWFDAMLYNRMNGKLTTLQYELMKLLSSVTNTSSSVEAMKNAAGTVTPTSVRAAATIITILPIICILSILTEVFRNRTYAWWRKRIKLKSSLFISCAAEVAQLIYYKMKQRA